MLRSLPWIILFSISLGCGGVLPKSAHIAQPAVETDGDMRQHGVAIASSNEVAQLFAELADTASGQARRAADNRKIIYTATVALVVDDFSHVEQTLSSRVNECGGFIASASIALNQGRQRSGTWTVRVPVASFEQFLDATGDLGVPERREQQGQDVTEEFVDLEARIRSKKQLEDRILELLSANKGEIKDVIEVERELSRVRTEIERMEGRMRYLADRTELTTVTVQVREEHDYKPPQAPGIGLRIASTWRGSTSGIVAAAENLLLGAVACLPWLLVAGVFAVPVWKWRRT